jgi:DNA primase
MRRSERLEEWLEANLDVRRREGDEWVAVCPFHQDASTTRPDLYVNVEKGVYNCFSGACGARGSALDLVRRVSGGDEWEARRELGSSAEASVLRCLRLIAGEGEEEPEELPVLPPHLVAYWRTDRYWVDQRRLLPRTCDRFQLGFDDAAQAGLIPWRDARGHTRGFIKRMLRGQVRYLYPRGFPQGALFNLDEVHPAREVIVVEGAIDAMRVWEAGLENVVALLGSSLPWAQLMYLAGLDLVALLDRDAAGYAATRKLVDGTPRVVRVARYPRGSAATDPDGLTHDEIRAAVANARPSWEVLP